MCYIDEVCVRMFVRDAYEVILNEFGGVYLFDLIFSDMMVNMSGIVSVDVVVLLYLVECVVDVVMSRGGGEGALRLRGDLVVKILEGDGSVEVFVVVCKLWFVKLNWFKLKVM